jgi:hypothetical protein
MIRTLGLNPSDFFEIEIERQNMVKKARERKYTVLGLAREEEETTGWEEGVTLDEREMCHCYTCSSLD